MLQPGMENNKGPVAPLVGPLRWAVDLRDASVRIDGPFEMGDFERRQPKLVKEAQKREEEARRREYDGATRGSEHDDKELPYSTPPPVTLSTF